MIIENEKKKKKNQVVIVIIIINIVIVINEMNFFRFVQFVNKNGGPQHLGVQLKAGGDIIDVSAVNSRIPNNLKKFLEGGEELLKKAKRYKIHNILPPCII